MTYFVNDLSLYSPKNRACKKLLDFISQFEHVLIKDDCSLDALSSLIEDRIREINTSHPKLRPICYSRLCLAPHFMICTKTASWPLPCC